MALREVKYEVFQGGEKVGEETHKHDTSMEMMDDILSNISEIILNLADTQNREELFRLHQLTQSIQQDIGWHIDGEEGHDGETYWEATEARIKRHQLQEDLEAMLGRTNKERSEWHRNGGKTIWESSIELR